MIKQHDHLLKIILIGSSGVGKSSVLMQFAQNKFSQTYLTTIGVDFRFKTIKHMNKSIKFQIWDTAGQQRFRTITSAYYKGADGIIMVYDLQQPSSLQDLQSFWTPQAFNYVDKNIDVLVLGNKSDGYKKVSDQKVKNFLQKYHFSHQQVSAKNGDKVYESISEFGIKILEKRLAKQNQINQNNRTGNQDSERTKQSKNVDIKNYKPAEPKYNKKCC